VVACPTFPNEVSVVDNDEVRELLVEKELLQNRILSLNKKNRALERDKKSKMYWISQEGLQKDRL